MAEIIIGNEKFTDVKEAKNKFVEVFGLSEDNAWAYMTVQVGFEDGDTEDRFIADIEKTEETQKVTDAEYIEKFLAHPEAVDIEFNPDRALRPIDGVWELL